MLIKMWKPDLEEFLDKVDDLSDLSTEEETFINKLEDFLDVPLSGNLYFDHQDLENYNSLKYKVSCSNGNIDEQ